MSQEEEQYERDEATKQGHPNYEQAYNILIEYFNHIPEEEQHKADKKLKECNL